VIPESYVDMLGALYSARRLGVRFELVRMTDAFAALGHPEQRLGTVFQVGGTNGKGSTAACLAAMLGAAGRKTGLYTSPHLCRFSERFRIGGVEASREAIGAAYQRIAAICEAQRLTFFEQATLLAVVLFADAGVDATVLEVGLGGRLDATTAVPADVAVVTGIALDHEDVLGTGLEAIAREKGGIFRAGRPAVIGKSGEPQGEALLVAEATTRGATPVHVVSAPWSGPLALRGAHQRWNAAAAVAALEVAAPIPSAARDAGLAAVSWPGRLEVLHARGRHWILDGAHNPHGAQNLAAHLPPGPFSVIVAVSSDKDAAGIVAPIAPRAAQVIACEAPSPRARPAAELAALAGGVAAPSWERALDLATAPSVVVYGSLFLVGAVRAALLGEELDPIPVQDPATRP
jgi:dihydrofolate synthase / folylpolyglutamate synthase